MTVTVADLRGDLTDDGEVGKGGRPRSDGPKRRSFTPEYKLAMVEAYEAATEPGAKGALLRREGLYHSHITVIVKPFETFQATCSVSELVSSLAGSLIQAAVGRLGGVGLRRNRPGFAA